MTSEPEQSKSAAAADTKDPPTAEASIKSVTGGEVTDPAAMISQQPSLTAVAVTQSSSDKERSSSPTSKIPSSAEPQQQPSKPVPSAAAAAVTTTTAESKSVAPAAANPAVNVSQTSQPAAASATTPAASQSQKPSSPVAASPRSSTPKVPPTLCINPNKANFTTAGGVSKHLMINKSTDRLAIKIRSSNNFFFRVNPVYSFLDCNAVNELEVIRLIGGGAKQDKLQVIYVVCTENDTDPTKLFGLRAKVRSVILPITTTAASTL